MTEIRKTRFDTQFQVLATFMFQTQLKRKGERSDQKFSI